MSAGLYDLTLSFLTRRLIVSQTVNGQAIGLENIPEV